MSWFTSAYKALAHGTPNWDTQLRTDMGFLESGVDQAPWSPGFGGTSASAGSGFASNGFVARIGQLVIYQGRISFGTSASWGTGDPYVSGFNSFSFNTDVTITGGSGRYQKASGGRPVPLHMAPLSSSTYTPFVVLGGTPSLMGALSTISASPANSDQLIFQLIGYMV